MGGPFDVNVWEGQFPFRRLAGTSLEETSATLSALGFRAAAVASFEALFQEDSYEAEVALSRRCGDLPSEAIVFHHMKIVNIAYNAWERDLDRALEELSIAGVRLCPTFHAYPLDHPAMARLMQRVREAELPVQIMCKMQDWRMQWILRTKDVEVDQVEPFLQRWSDAELILSGLHVSDMRQLAPLLGKCPRLLLDCSRLKGPWRTFEKLAEVMPLERLCFGSLWPINLPDCPLMQLRASTLDPALVESILAAPTRFPAFSD